MPLILSLAAPGSPCRLLRPSARLAGQWQPAPRLTHLRHTANLSLSLTCHAALHRQDRRPVALRTLGTPISLHDSISKLSTRFSEQAAADERATDGEEDNFEFFEEEATPLGPGNNVESDSSFLHTHREAATDETGIFDFVAGEGAKSAAESGSAHQGSTPKEDPYRSRMRTPFKAQRSRNQEKAYRRNQTTTVLDGIQTDARALYFSKLPRKIEAAHNSPERTPTGGHRWTDRYSLPSPTAAQDSATSTSLRTILARYLSHLTAAATEDTPFLCTPHEHNLLQREGLTQEVVQSWALSLLDKNPNTAARIFLRGAAPPPFFLVLLFLRREHIRRYALGAVLSHISSRLDSEQIGWCTLKTLVVRVLRHARRIWPESLPWISTVFLDKAAKIFDTSRTTNSGPRDSAQVTPFCNNLLSLLSLPSSIRPMIASRHQEDAQFLILQFMAGYDPPIAVTRTGFRAIARIQLTHAKTEQERDWAELKGPSWPPWTESRTAMDEDKSYDYGASRASKILHRMFESGYAARSWEKVAEVYAGWDTDLSPTIQTRALLRSEYRGDRTHRLWAARIRTTRTRREAWAAFLAHEASDDRTHEDIYLAMFEKLYYMEFPRKGDGELHQGMHLDGSQETPDSPEDQARTLLPGDMKEVLSEPTSPLHNVYLREAVPTYEQLYHRMTAKNMRPTGRLLAFLLETHPDFATMFKLLDKARGDFDGGVGCLLAGPHDETSKIHNVPDYFLAAFFRFLCRFGQPTKGISTKTTFLAPEQHIREFMFNENYLLEYAYALLLHYKPRYQPIWCAFMERVVFSRFGSNSLHHEKDSQTGITDVQYNIVIRLLDTLASVHVDVEGDMFNLACTATRYAAQAVHRGKFSFSQGRNFLTGRSYRLRTLFHHLVGAHVDLEVPAHLTSIPPHIPGPAELHVYVRALGVLRDYEGLYSFSTWLTKHNVEVIARARAQHGGSDMLFRTLVALRAATSGWLEEGLDTRPKAPEEIKQLIKAQIDSVEEWGGWPSKKYVTLYIEGHVRSATPVVGGR
ncbi:uncharacterized protein M421DRAFT_420165 [Didymella exigua CBS 183.55]|uniref:Uncharacterized protein n=1 Tax=Didymella exigua CBS 183.55 TaxID=1150837 RepID=A0A6A5RUA1_9PLEO|nr:uncharacterized protein M421DRAFT_420165 [Didymella exigua CBS 183.55]KAF1928937.1 hypothetical protein M421DRAFT_420165 [Didymella exigua CBS 183.55]